MESSVKIDLREMGFWGVDWIHVAQDRDRCRALEKAVFWDSLKVGNFLTT
jgi:hypothetical protein